MTESDRRTLPIFALPDAVLFPETTLPLHIFEPRYRQMVSDALSGDRLIGIQRMKPGGALAPENPPLFEIGCAGEIREHEPLEDGRSNIVLFGLFRYRLVTEIPGGPYRRAEVAPLSMEPLSEVGDATTTRRNLRRLLARSIGRLADSVGRPQARELPTNVSDEALVNEALGRLGLDADDRYKLLTMSRLTDRYAWVVDHVAALQRRLDLLAPYRRPDADPRWN